MKNKIKLLIACLVLGITSLMAQSPNMINYQGVARDSSGNPIGNQQIRLRFKIRDNTSNGTIEFTEVRKVTTSASGLFNCQIGGSGSISQTGSLGTLPWEDGDKYLQVEMDPSGGNNFTNMGAQQLSSVPYALHAKQANELAPGSFLPFSKLDTTGATFGSLNMLFFDGSSYVPSKLLPYNASDPNLISFTITNTNALGGQAIYGMNTVDHANATGVRGECNKANGRGVYGKAYGLNAFGVYAENTTGVAIKGKATGTTGIGVVGESNSNDGINGISNSSTSGVAGVRGINNGTNGRGVVGAANAASSRGVEGTSNDGIGVFGYSNVNTGVYGSVISGTALKGYSISGYGLDVTGKVKIAGGNTTPGAGKVLTSDSSGNATWQAPAKAAFKAGSSVSTFPEGQYTKVDWSNVLYDLSGSFNNTTNVFTVPVSGVYNFTAAAQISINSNIDNFSFSGITIMLNRGGNISCLGYGKGPIFVKTTYCATSLMVTTDAQLLAGDQIFVELYQQQTSSNHTATIQGNFNDYQFFTGHLVTAN